VSGCREFHGEYSSMEAEYYAVAEALRVASVRSSGCERVTVYSDCKPLLSKLRGDERCYGDWAEYYTSCQWLLGKFAEWELVYCPRENNRDAHELARTALERGRS
jgi:ribonuclease HI